MKKYEIIYIGDFNLISKIHIEVYPHDIMREIANKNISEYNILSIQRYDYINPELQIKE